jgi:hypothetical protein
MPKRLAMIRIRVVGDEEEFGAAGELTAVVCKNCGYTEFYVLDPESIKPDGKYVHEMNGSAPSAGPRR